MSRWREVAGAAAWWAVALASLLWWAPAITLALAPWAGGRLRFAAVIGLGRVLVEVGAVGAARRVHRSELERARRRLRAIRERRGW